MDDNNRIFIFCVNILNDNVNLTNISYLSSWKTGLRQITRFKNVQYKSIFSCQKYHLAALTLHNSSDYCGNLLLYGWSFKYWRTIFLTLFKFWFNVILWCIYRTFTRKCNFRLKGRTRSYTNIFITNDNFLRVFQE